MDFHTQMQKKLALHRQRNRKMKRYLLAFLLLCSAWLSCGFYFSNEGELVQEVYTVRSGDTLRGISERYLAQNTGSNSYILEFEHGIKELNPWLEDRHGLLLPGDELIICYKTSRNP